MTALQQITKEAKKIRAKNKNIAWTDAIKKASLSLRKAGKIGATKKAAPVKKRVAKKSAAKKVYQTGRSEKLYDEVKKAKAPGKRKSASGNVYYERRKNRSDMPGKLTGVPQSKLIGAVKQQIKDSLGAAYVGRDMAKTKRDKKAYQKNISSLRSKLRKLS